MVTYGDGLPAHRQMVTHPSTNPAVHGLEMNSQPFVTSLIPTHHQFAYTE